MSMQNRSSEKDIHLSCSQEATSSTDRWQLCRGDCDQMLLTGLCIMVLGFLSMVGTSFLYIKTGRPMGSCKLDGVSRPHSFPVLLQLPKGRPIVIETC